MVKRGWFCCWSSSWGRFLKKHLPDYGTCFDAKRKLWDPRNPQTNIDLVFFFHQFSQHIWKPSKIFCDFRWLHVGDVFSETWGCRLRFPWSVAATNIRIFPYPNASCSDGWFWWPIAVLFTLGPCTIRVYQCFLRISEYPFVGPWKNAKDELAFRSDMPEKSCRWKL